jgi:septation ring formation regulator EzrA
VRAEAVRIKEQLGRTAAATRKLAKSRASNLAGSLDSFSTNLGNLKSTLAGARETVRAPENQTTAYFASWDEQLRRMSEEMQKTGQKRQAEVMASFAALRADLAEVRDSLKPFVDALSEIEQYLRTDQTKAGLDTVSSRLRSTADQEHVIRRGLDKLTQQIDTIQRKH